MAAADTTTADSISGLGEALQNLVNINVAGFAGIQSSLRSEFSGQNKLLGGYLGKNLQIIADAITGANEDMLSQMQADARAAAEAAREALAGKGGGDAAGGVEATDSSLQLSPLTIIAAVTGFIVGFFQGFFGPMGTLMKSWGGAIKKFFGKPLKWGWTTFKAMLKDSKVAGWYRSVKNWFSAKAWDAKFKWAKFKDMLKNSKFVTWIKSVKSWFAGKVGGPKMTSVKALFAESKIGKLITSIKNWFKLPTGAKLPKIKALWANSTIGKGITAIKNLFSGGIKIPGVGAVDDLVGKVKGLFGPTGPFKIFATIGRAFGKIFFFVQIIMSLFDFYTGFMETEGNLLDKILGGLKGALMGFIGGFLDLGIMLEDAIKWIVTKIAGFFGFDEKEIGASMESFSIFKPLKQMLEDVIDWFIALFDFSSFSAGLISAAKLLFLPITALLDLTGFIWDWFMGLFGWKDENAPKDDRTVTTKLGDLLVGIWDWFLDLFGFGASAEGHSAEMPADDGQTVMGKLLSLVTGVWTWFKGLFDFSSVGAGLASAAKLIFLPLTALLSLVTGVWTWFKGLFGFNTPEEDADSAKGVGGFLNDLIAGVWGYFKKLFKFGSVGDVMKSYFNLLTFFPNIIKDAIAGVTSWLLGLFGFDEAAKTVANAKNFSLGDMLFNAIESIWLWFKDLLGIDVKAIAKMIPGASALLSLMDDSAAEKNVEGMKKMGLMKTEKGMLDDDQVVDIGKLQGMMKGMSLAGIKDMMMDMKEINESDLPGKGDEIANWEVVQKTLMEGAKLAALQKESNELSGSGGTTTIIQDNSQNTSNSSQGILMPTEPIVAQSPTRLE